MQSTASDATLVALLAAKAKAMAGRPREDAERLIAYSSDQVSASLQAALSIRGYLFTDAKVIISERVSPDAKHPRIVQQCVRT